MYLPEAGSSMGFDQQQQRSFPCQIESLPLWIGHAGDSRAFRDIFASGIRAIVQLALEEPPVQPPRELVYLRFPLLDGPGNDPQLLHLVIDVTAMLVQRKVPTLVCCGAGMSRSPVIAAAALTTTLGLPFEKCLGKMLEGRPADVSPGLLAEVRAALGDQN